MSDLRCSALLLATVAACLWPRDHLVAADDCLVPSNSTVRHLVVSDLVCATGDLVIQLNASGIAVDPNDGPPVTVTLREQYEAFLAGVGFNPSTYDFLLRDNSTSPPSLLYSDDDPSPSAEAYVPLYDRRFALTVVCVRCSAPATTVRIVVTTSGPPVAVWLINGTSMFGVVGATGASPVNIGYGSVMWLETFQVMQTASPRTMFAEAINGPFSAHPLRAVVFRNGNVAILCRACVRSL